MTKTMSTGLIAALMVMASLAAQKPEAAETLLQTAIKKEVVDGNLAGAIEGYRKALAAAKDNRVVAAQALVHMAECYQKLGDAQSRKIYEQIVREYADQREPVATARARLAGGAANAGLTTRQMWTGPKVDAYGSVSPDGRFLSFTDWDTGDLALHDFTTGQDRRLTNKGAWGESPAFALMSAISRDGKQVAYEWLTEAPNYFFELRLIDLDSGKSRLLVPNTPGLELVPLDWSPDGKWIAAFGARIKDYKWDLALISTADGSLRVLRTSGWNEGGGKVMFSADGKYLAYNAGPTDKPEVHLLALDGSGDTPVLAESANDRVLGWSPDGTRLLFASDRSGLSGVWSIVVKEGKPQGAPELLKANINPLPLGVTRAGALYYSVVSSVPNIYLASVDFDTGNIRSGPTPLAQSHLALNNFPQWSHDGKYLAYFSKRNPNSRNSQLDILAIRSDDNGQVRELHPDMRMLNRGVVPQPLWSPDGRSVLVNGTDRHGQSGVFRIDTQTGDAGAVIAGDRSRQEVFARAWSPDGRTLYLVKADAISGGTETLFAHDMQSGSEREILRRQAPAGQAALGRVALTRDGRRLAVVAFDRTTQTGSLLVIPADGGAPRELLRTSNSGPDQLGVFVEWSPDANYVIFRKGGRPAIRETFRIPADGGTPVKYASDWTPGPHSINPDGRQVAFAMGQHKIEVWAMENFLPDAKASR